MLTTIWQSIWRLAFRRRQKDSAAPVGSLTTAAGPACSEGPRLRRTPNQQRTASLLMKGDIPAERQPPPPPPLSAAEQMRRSVRDAQMRAEYEKAFPYEKPNSSDQPGERVSKRGPTASGGLPSLGKRR